MRRFQKKKKRNNLSYYRQINKTILLRVDIDSKKISRGYIIDS